VVGAAVDRDVGTMVVHGVASIAVASVLGILLEDIVGITVGVEVVGIVMGKSASSTLQLGSRIKGVHTTTQQKHRLVTVFQLKTRGIFPPQFSKQYL
jgi:hypothetical protein